MDVKYAGKIEVYGIALCDRGHLAWGVLLLLILVFVIIRGHTAYGQEQNYRCQYNSQSNTNPLLGAAFGPDSHTVCEAAAVKYWAILTASHAGEGGGVWSHVGCDKGILNFYWCTYNLERPDKPDVTGKSDFWYANWGNCAEGTVVNPDVGICETSQPPACPTGKMRKNGQCVISERSEGSRCVGNPCDPATGNKHQVEPDYTVAGTGIALIRSYNSAESTDVGFGVGWTSPLHKALEISGDQLTIKRSNGRGEPWTRTDAIWSADPDARYNLSEDAGGFNLTLQDGGSERYDSAGNILAETTAAGLATRYEYDANSRLIRVVGPFGHALSIVYDGNNHIAKVIDPAGGSYSYGYDESGNLTRVVYPDDTVRAYHYEAVDFPNHLTGITDQNGDRYATYTYDGVGRAVSTAHAQTDNGAPQESFLLDYSAFPVTTVTDPAGEVWEYGHQLNLGVFNQTGSNSRSDGASISQQYDPNNNLISRTDEAGRITAHTYNGSNQRIATRQAVGTAQERITHFEYVSTEVNLPTRVATPSVHGGSMREVLTTYDDDLNATSVSIRGFQPDGAPVSRTTAFQYNDSGQVVQIDGPRTDVADVTMIAYYDCIDGAECGRPASVTDALGYTTTFDSYSSHGQLTRSTDPLGVVTTRQYDALNRVVSMERIPPHGLARATKFRYDGLDQLISTTTADGTTLSYDYDAAHGLRVITDNLGNSIEYDYDLKGNRIRQNIKDPDGTLVRSIAFTHDLRNREASIDAAGSVTRIVRNAVGNPVSVSDPNLNPDTLHSHDALDRLTETMDALSGSTGYEYDSRDNLTRLTAPNGSSTSHTYDDLGNLVREASPDRGTLVYDYDAAGNVVSLTDARGVTVHYSYDELNRITWVDYMGLTHAQNFEYDDCENGAGRLCQILDEFGRASLAYDVYGNLTRHTKTYDGDAYPTLYEYDAGDRIVRMTYPHGGSVWYTRDVIGRTTDVGFEINGIPFSIVDQRSYRADGLATSQYLGNGLLETRRYDLRSKLLEQTLDGVDARQYSYDANGNVLSRTQFAIGEPGVLTANYLYDPLDRILQESRPDTVVAFSYDQNGNRLTRDKEGKNLAYSYSEESNRLVLVNDKQILLDPAGNTLSDRGGKRSFEYDASGRLKRVYKNGVLNATYFYDAQGRRTRKIRDTATGQKTFAYHYDLNGNLIAEDRNGSPYWYYIWLDSQPLAQINVKRKNNGDLVVKQVTYITTDHLLTPRLGTDENKNVVWRWDSDAFGQDGPDTDADGDGRKRRIDLRFPGQFHDRETGLHYNWHRYYDPQTGRYITSDPIGIDGGVNTYSYAHQNPTGLTDRFGLESALDGSIIGGSQSGAFDNAVGGFGSYFRAHSRGIRYSLRRYGAFGRCEQRYAELEGQILGALARRYSSNSAFRSFVHHRISKIILSSKAAVFGRFMGGSAFTNALLRGIGGLSGSVGLGSVFAIGAAIGDARLYVEAVVKVPASMHLNDFLNQVILGESDLISVIDFDSVCSCESH